MANNTQPIHIGTVNGKRVRLFAAPEGELPSPWCSVDDLLRAIGYSDSQQMEIVLKASRTVEMRQISTDRGVVTVVSGETVEHLIHDFAGWGVGGETILDEYRAAERRITEKPRREFSFEDQIEALLGEMP